MTRSNTNLRMTLLAALSAASLGGALMPAQAQTTDAMPADRSQVRSEAVQRTRSEAQNVNGDSQPVPMAADRRMALSPRASTTLARDVQHFHEEAIEQNGGY